MPAKHSRPKTYLETLTRWTGLPWWPIWIPMPFFIILFDYFLTVSFLGTYGLYGTAISWAFFSAACNATVVWAARLFDRYRHSLGQGIEITRAEFEAWYEDRMRFSFYSKWTLCIGLAVALLFSLTVALFAQEISGGDLFLTLTRIAILVPSVFGPALMWPMVIGTCVLGHKIAKLPIKVPIREDHENSIMSLGTLFLRLMGIVAVCYALALVVLVSSPVAGNPVAMAWAGATAIAILLGFVIPQVGVHRVMAREKRERLRTVDMHLENGINQVLVNPCAEVVFQVADLLEIRRFLNETNEWPFSWKAIWQLSTVIFLPFFLALIPMILR